MTKSLTLLLLLLATICSAQITKVGTYRMSYYGLDRAVCTDKIGNSTNICIQGYTKEKGTTAYLVMYPSGKISNIESLIKVRDLYVQWKAEAVKQNTKTAKKPFPEMIKYCGFQWETATDYGFCSEYPLTAYFVVEDGKCYVDINATPIDPIMGLKQEVYFRFANESEIDAILEIIKKY